MKTGFYLSVLNSYKWPVDVMVPTIDEEAEGNFEVHRFTGEFKYLTPEETKQVFEGLQAKIEATKRELEASPELIAIRTGELIADYQIELYSDIWVGWSNLFDQDGKQLEVSDSNKQLLLKQRIVREAVMHAHRESQGGEAARTKNYKTSPEAGQATGEK